MSEPWQPRVLAPDRPRRQHHDGDRAGAVCDQTPTRFEDLGRLRVQECERVAALRDELRKCGARVEETGDTLIVHPGPLHGAEIETYNDHRVAMCFAMLGLRVPGMRLRNPACVRKTFPNFFAKLASLGATVNDAHTAKPLEGDALLA